MNADHGKTAATTEVVSSHPAETRHWNSKRRRNTFCAWKNRWRTEKKNCKSMKRDENDQSYKKESTPVVGKRPNGKSQLKPCPLFPGWKPLIPAHPGDFERQNEQVSGCDVQLP
jgi:hypothetical protein